MVISESRRRAARHAVDHGLCGITQTCRASSLVRLGYYRVKRMSAGSITTLLKRERCRINAKRAARVRRVEGLQVSKRQRRTRRVGPGQAQRLSATIRNQVWICDFVLDQTESGGAFRILTLLDEHTRQCLATHAVAAKCIKTLYIKQVPLGKTDISNPSRTSCATSASSKMSSQGS